MGGRGSETGKNGTLKRPRLPCETQIDVPLNNEFASLTARETICHEESAQGTPVSRLVETRRVSGKRCGSFIDNG